MPKNTRKTRDGKVSERQMLCYKLDAESIKHGENTKELYKALTGLSAAAFEKFIIDEASGAFYLKAFKEAANPKGSIAIHLSERLQRLDSNTKLHKPVLVNLDDPRLERVKFFREIYSRAFLADTAFEKFSDVIEAHLNEAGDLTTSQSLVSFWYAIYKRMDEPRREIFWLYYSNLCEWFDFLAEIDNSPAVVASLKESLANSKDSFANEVPFTVGREVYRAMTPHQREIFRSHENFPFDGWWFEFECDAALSDDQLNAVAKIFARFYGQSEKYTTKEILGMWNIRIYANNLGISDSDEALESVGKVSPVVYADLQPVNLTAIQKEFMYNILQVRGEFNFNPRSEGSRSRGNGRRASYVESDHEDDKLVKKPKKPKPRSGPAIVLPPVSQANKPRVSARVIEDSDEDRPLVRMTHTTAGSKRPQSEPAVAVVKPVADSSNGHAPPKFRRTENGQQAASAPAVANHPNSLFALVDAAVVASLLPAPQAVAQQPSAVVTTLTFATKYAAIKDQIKELLALAQTAEEADEAVNLFMDSAQDFSQLVMRKTPK